MKLPPNIEYIEGKSNGPCVVIMGAIHGNERLGEGIIARLLHDIKPENLHGELVLIIGNPEAYANHKRFMDSDLNRLFGPQFEMLMKKPFQTFNIEEKRAVEIAPFLQQADYLLDIHSTIKPSVPFVYCENTKAHLDLAYLFETEYVVSPAAHSRIPDLTSCSDNYVDQHGGIGITYEAGWHRGPTIFPEVMTKTYKFLYAVGSLETPASTSGKYKKNSKKVAINDYIIPQTPDFHFKKDFSNFDCVEKGEIIAEDGAKLFKAHKKSFVVFPKIDIVSGSPACYLAS